MIASEPVLATIGCASASGTVLVRADPAHYRHHIVAACRRAGARFSVTARLTPTVVKAITGIDEQAWVPIRYPNAISTTTSSDGYRMPRSPKPP